VVGILNANRCAKKLFLASKRQKRISTRLQRKFHKITLKVNIGQFKTFMARIIVVTTHNLECHSQSIRPSASLTSNYTKFYVMVSIAFLEATRRTSHDISS
jgi:hypothetical protein